jgi:ATP-dependent Clp protease, protease subunit
VNELLTAARPSVESDDEMSVHTWAMNKLLSDMFDDRTIIVSGELGTSASTDVISQLLLLNTTGSDQEIRLYIDSATGSLSAGFAICDTINWIKPDVSTWAIGTAGVAATLVLCSGAMGKRYALPGSTIVLELPGRDECLAGELLTSKSAPYQRWLDEMVQVLSRRTGQGSNTIARDLRNNHRLSATDSVAYGIVDRVMSGGRHVPQGN